MVRGVTGSVRNKRFSTSKEGFGFLPNAFKRIACILTSTSDWLIKHQAKYNAWQLDISGRKGHYIDMTFKKPNDFFSSIATGQPKCM